MHSVGHGDNKSHPVAFKGSLKPPAPDLCFSAIATSRPLPLPAFAPAKFAVVSRMQVFLFVQF